MHRPVHHPLLGGARAIVPILLGVVPFGLVTGAGTVAIGIPAAEAILMSALVFAGTAQLAAVDLIGKGAPFLVVVGTALVVNLRFLMYSAALAPHFSRLPAGWRSALAYLISDQAFLVSVARFRSDLPAREQPWFYLGAALTLWVTWQIAFALGAILGTQLPPSWSLDFAVPLTLLALLPGALRDRTAVVAGVVTGGAVLVAAGLPLQLGLVVAVVAGVAAGLLVPRREEAVA
ncbi:AzlC family ABC transporter permease [bacterium]|nr:AzlC family ABC transporter permease [bacterium]